MKYPLSSSASPRSMSVVIGISDEPESET